MSAELSTNDDLVVRIRGSRFEPGELVVTRGSRVTWSNQDDIVHNVTALGETRFSNDIVPRGSLTYGFAKVGRHEYVCDKHPAMRGYIVVE